MTSSAQEETELCEKSLPNNWELAYFSLFIFSKICMSKAQ